MNRQRTSAAIVIGAAIALTLPFGTGAVQASTPAPTEESTTWSIEPATADGPNSRVSLRHTIDPGAAVQDFVTVTNFSAQSETFGVYAGDGVVSDAGDFDLLPTDEPPVGGGSWISIDMVDGATPRPGGGQIVEVGPGTAVTLPVSIQVPADASPGDHPAGVVAELVRGDGDAVQMATRVGVRVHLRVSGDVVAAVAADDVTAAWDPSWNPFAPGTVTVDYALLNDGNVRAGTAVLVAVEGPFGLAAAETTQEVREILPGGRTEMRIELPVWPLAVGWGQITVTPAAVGEDAAPVQAESTRVAFTVWTIPWAQLALLAALLLLVLVVRRMRKRAQTQVQARIDAAVASAVAAAPVTDSDDDQSEVAGRPVESRATSVGSS